jgi:hypothetical protein
MLAVAIVALALPGSAGAQATGFRVGAAKVDTTPPAFSAATDAQDFALCPRDVMTGPRAYRYQEPYVDQNGNGRYDYPEPFCDQDANQRYDGMYLSGALNAIAAYPPHDPIDARAVAIADGSRTYVLISVVAQGIFENYLEEVRNRVKQLEPAITSVIVSANHNESSPDTVGIYGAPEIPAVGVGARSSVNEYYMDFLVERMAEAAVAAYRDLRPASIWARQVELPKNLAINLSNNYPTTFDKKELPAAIDPKMRIVQARDAGGRPIATLLGLAAHNQQTGHSGRCSPLPGGTECVPLAQQISSDWPGWFNRKLESGGQAGLPIFFAGENGSQEDPETVPDVHKNFPECLKPDGGNDGCHPQNKATGEALADAVASEAPKADQVPFGALRFDRRELQVPIENNAFKAAFFAGLFGERPTYTAGQKTDKAGTDARTFVSVLDIGPALQVVANPGEAFPALTIGGPHGIDEVTCPNRPNPAIPIWHAKGAFRFQAGLADDLIGYEIPPWAFVEPGVFTTDECDAQSSDPKGHSHKLEAEGLGPTASAMVANELASILDAHGMDPTAEIRPGRFILPDGKLTRRPTQGAVGAWIADRGATALTPGKGTVVALDGYTGFGSRAVDASGRMMDFDGIDQPGSSNVLTRGVVLFGCDGKPAKRYYLDVYPALSGSDKPLGAATRGSVGAGCGAGQPDLGVPGNPATGPSLVPGPAACRDRTPPRTVLDRTRVGIGRSGVSMQGRAADTGCKGSVAAVLVSVARIAGNTCRFLQPNGRFTGPRNCRRPVLLRARGTKSWKLVTRVTLPPGAYRLHVRSVDNSGNKEKPSTSNRALVRVR